jgi:FkbM family methyltransferase
MLQKKREVHDDKLGKLYFPKNDNVMAPSIAVNGNWEPREIQWLEKNVKLESRCLNVGANIGYFTILMSLLSGPNGIVFAFEPNPDLKWFLNKNIKMRAFKNIQVFYLAAGEKNSSEFFYKNRNNFGDGRMFDPRITSGGGTWQSFGFDSRIPKTKVKVKRIADLGLGQIDVALIDAQGFDHFVLRGMDLRNNHRPKILTEFVPEWIKSQGDNPVEILKEYKSWGYSVASIDFPELNALSEKDLIEGISELGHYFTNLALIPR